jgi:polyhydroxyalkanoate synthesis repressor PhaR
MPASFSKIPAAQPDPEPAPGVHPQAGPDSRAGLDPQTGPKVKALAGGKTTVEAHASMAAAVPALQPVVVKKYANRRLYNTDSSSYITLDNLAEMVRSGRDFVVFDAKTGEDITRSVLTQIIVEEEGKGKAMLPTGFLRQLIGFYGNSMQGLVPNYLEKAMEAFAEQQEKVRATVQETVGTLFPGMEEVSRQNLAMMERAMGMFAPFYRSTDITSTMGSPDTDNEMEVLRAEVERLRKALDEAKVTSDKPLKS